MKKVEILLSDGVNESWTSYKKTNGFERARQEGSSSENSIIFQPMLMSIILGQNKRMRQIQKTLRAIQPSPDISEKDEEPDAQKHQAEAVYFKKKKPGGEQTRLS